MKRIWSNYSLSITLFVLFLLSWVAQAYFQALEGESLNQFLAATFENWESEFLQLFAFVVLTSFLYHRGSHESKDSDEEMKAQLDRIEQRLK
jgi:hypothetical protein